MVFNLSKKSQVMPTQQMTINPMGTLDFGQAAAIVLSMYPDFTDINDLMETLNLDVDSVMMMAQKTDSGELKDAIPEVQRVEDATNILQNVVPITNEGNVKVYNHKEAQEISPPMDPMGLNDSPELVGDTTQEMQGLMDTKKFNTHSELKDWLLKFSATHNPFARTWPIIQAENPRATDEAQQTLKNFFEGLEMKSAEAILDEANTLYNFIYGAEEDTMQIEAPYGSPKDFAENSSADIKKMAEDVVKKKIGKKAKSFNLKKMAQHKTLENTIMWGSDQTRIDPFLRQPVSDWHIVERNKGFGLVVDDVWNIDYESIWRENIMDKYSRPYRDKEGNWVGGYIQKRFEVDKNIPETSNYQLKPGQKRKPVIPEHGNTESRLQAARAAGDVAGAKNTSQLFNWKEAQAKKKS